MEDISLHILDIAENSINAGATLVKITIEEDTENDVFSLEIADNGRGIPADIINEVLDPFFSTRKTRKIGLGLSLLAQSARETGGDIAITSKENSGAVVTASFKPGHIDMKPLGNLADTFFALMTGNPGVDFVITFARKDNGYSLDTRELKADLDGLPLNAPAVLPVLRDYLARSTRN